MHRGLALAAAAKKLRVFEGPDTPLNPWIPLTPEELAALGESALADHNERTRDLLENEPLLVPVPDEPIEIFTCWRCSQASRCPYAYDAYNTGSDCLADK